MLKLKEYYYDTDIYGGIIDNKITMEFEIKDDKRWSARKFESIHSPLLKQTIEDEYATDVVSEKQMREIHAYAREAINNLEEVKKENEKLICQLVKERYERDRGKNTDIDRVRYATMRFIGGNEIPKVKQVITDNPPYTTILFEDGTKQVVKARTKISYENKGILPSPATTILRKETEYDKDKGIMIALLERIYGKKEFYKIMGW